MNEVEIKFVDTSKECIKMMKKLTKKGLMNAGKLVKKTLKEKIPRKTGSLQASVRARVEFDKSSGIPTLMTGYSNSRQMQKKGYKHYVNPYWFEFGIKPHTIQTKESAKGGKLTYKLRDSKGIEYGYIVDHPGMTNKNFLRNTVYDNIDEIQKALKEGLQELDDYQITQGMKIDDEEDEDIE